MDVDQAVVSEVLDRLLGAKVCLQEVLNISPLSKEHEAIFDAALDAAVELEEQVAGLLD